MGLLFRGWWIWILSLASCSIFKSPSSQIASTSRTQSSIAAQDANQLRKAQCSKLPLQRKDWSATDIKNIILCTLVSSKKNGSAHKQQYLDRLQTLPAEQFTQTQLWIAEQLRGENQYSFIKNLENLPTDLGTYMKSHKEILIHPLFAKHWEILERLLHPSWKLVKSSAEFTKLSQKPLGNIQLDSGTMAQSLSLFLSAPTEKRKTIIEQTRKALNLFVDAPHVQRDMGKLSAPTFCKKDHAITQTPLPLTLQFIAESKYKPDIFIGSFLQSFTFWEYTCQPTLNLEKEGIAELLSFLSAPQTFSTIANFGNALLSGSPQLEESLIQWGSQILKFSSENGNLLKVWSQNHILEEAYQLFEENSLNPSDLSKNTEYFKKLLQNPPPLLEWWKHQDPKVAELPTLLNQLHFSAPLFAEWQNIFKEIGSSEALGDIAEVIETGQLQQVLHDLSSWNPPRSIHSEELKVPRAFNFEGLKSTSFSYDEELLREAHENPLIRCLFEPTHLRLLCLSHAGSVMPVTKDFLTSTEAFNFFTSYRPHDTVFHFLKTVFPLPINGPRFETFASNLVVMKGSSWRLPAVFQWLAELQSFSDQERRLLSSLQIPSSLAEKTFSFSATPTASQEVLDKKVVGQLKNWLIKDAATNFFDLLSQEHLQEAWVESFRLSQKHFIIKNPIDKQIYDLSTFEALDMLLGASDVSPLGLGENSYVLEKTLGDFFSIKNDQKALEWVQILKSRLSQTLWVLKHLYGSKDTNYRKALLCQRILDQLSNELTGKELYLLSQSLGTLFRSNGSSTSKTSLLLGLKQSGALASLSFFMTQGIQKQNIPLPEIQKKLRINRSWLEPRLQRFFQQTAQILNEDDLRFLSKENSKLQGRPLGLFMCGVFYFWAHPNIDGEHSAELRHILDWWLNGLTQIFLPQIPEFREHIQTDPSQAVDELMTMALSVLSDTPHPEQRAQHLKQLGLLAQELLQKPDSQAFLNYLSEPSHQGKLMEWVQTGNLYRVLEWAKLIEAPNRN